MFLFAAMVFAAEFSFGQDARLDSLQLQLKSSNENYQNLSAEFKKIESNLINLNTIVNFLSKSNNELETKVKLLESQTQRLILTNDSLLKSGGSEAGNDFVSNPKTEADSIVYVIQNYYKAGKWEDRLPFVLNSLAVKPLMEEAYKDRFKSYLIKKEEINIPGQNRKTGKAFKVYVDGTPVYLKKTSEGVKLDWEATSGYNPKSIAEFSSEKSETPTTFRASLRLSEFYLPDYGISKNSHLALSMDEIGFCYISNTNSKYAELKKLLSDGKEHQVIVEVQFRTLNNEYGSMESVIITKFIKDGWDRN